MMENGIMGKWSGEENFYIETNNYIKDNFLMALDRGMASLHF